MLIISISSLLVISYSIHRICNLEASVNQSINKFLNEKQKNCSQNSTDYRITA